MSHPLASRPPSSLPRDLDLEPLAASLRALLDALSPFLEAGRRDNDDVQDEPHQEGDPDRPQERGGQTRTYYLSPGVLREEQDLLSRWATKSSFELMSRTVDQMSIVVTLMDQVDNIHSLPECFMIDLADQFREWLDVLEWLTGIVGEMELVTCRDGRP